MLTSEDKELIKTRREYHLVNSDSDIKIPAKTLVKEVEIEPKKTHLDNYKNIVMEEQNIGSLAGISGELDLNIQRNKNILANFENEKIEEKNEPTDQTTNNAAVEPKYTDHINAINKLRPQLTASKLYTYNESLWKSLNSDLY